MESICRFIKDDDLKHCTKKRKALSNFCEEHVQYYKGKSNEEVLVDLSYSARKCMVVTDDKKIGASQDKRSWASFTNLFNEMANRGYHREELIQAISDIHKNKGMLDDLIAGVSGNKKWKKFEKLVEAIHIAKSDGAVVNYDEKLVGKRTGRERQVDISIRFEHSFYSYFVAVECKDYKHAVPISEVESFVTKLEDLRADKGVMVSSNGFQQGAIETAATHNIELFTLEEEMSDWVSSIRELSFSVPFPINITLDHLPLPKEKRKNNPQQVSLVTVLFSRTSSEKPVSLANILKDVCVWAHDERLDLPARVDLKFGETYEMCMPGTEEPIPVHGMMFNLVQYRYAESKTIDMPPKLTSYNYKDILRNITHTLALSEVPK